MIVPDTETELYRKLTITVREVKANYYALYF